MYIHEFIFDCIQCSGNLYIVSFESIAVYNNLVKIYHRSKNYAMEKY